MGLIWNPTKATPRALKPFLGYSSAPAPSEVSLALTAFAWDRTAGELLASRSADGQAALVTMDKAGVLGEIGRLGRGLIEKIESR